MMDLGLFLKRKTLLKVNNYGNSYKSAVTFGLYSIFY